MPKNYDELVEEARRFLAEGERLQREAILHLDNPEIQAAVDRYIVEADLLARALEKSSPAE
jgi:hypothetical protein